MFGDINFAMSYYLQKAAVPDALSRTPEFWPCTVVGDRMPILSSAGEVS